MEVVSIHNTSNEFKQFLVEQGINHEVSAPYTPQHSGLAERRNRAVLNMVRSMLREKSLPSYLWGEAVNTVVYILNKWSGKKPMASHLRVFGALCYSHIPEQRRTKLQDKSKQILVGYHPNWSNWSRVCLDIKYTFTEEPISSSFKFIVSSRYICRSSNDMHKWLVFLEVG
jgi:predicted DNA-binding protein (MmcQ/YjbR family)